MAAAVETAIDPIQQPVRLCCLKPQRPLPPTLGGDRLHAIGIFKKFWVAGTQVSYAFVPDGPNDSVEQRNAVRKAFGTWARVGLNITFKEVKSDWQKAMIRISFDFGGTASVVGTDALSISADQPTMNFGWSLADQPGTAEHEVGHVLGLHHEHQNPNSPLVWDEEAVLKELKGAPNFWTEDDIRTNVLDKVPLSEVKGSAFDPTSIMEYPFDGKLIKEPENLRKTGIPYNSVLSDTDKTVVAGLYQKAPVPMAALREFVVTPFAVEQGQTAQAQFVPKESAAYTVSVYGTDVLLTLHDKKGRTIAAQDIAGEDDKKGAVVSAPLKAGETYTVSVRRYFDAEGTNEPLMLSAFHRRV
eukprot:TRINITY_DN9277_c0_g1_i1.p1 TRINITY_DN9277_c0_g1~~TRINITY_DN9277_c0_g1_i1.p1  ORF type:complete len:357 (+),score=120.47 TRINITY_DN9277_c0_g1_i1:104-1174(+)